MVSTIFIQKYTFSAIGTFAKCKASEVDDSTTHHLRIKSKVKYNRFSVPEQNLGLRLRNGTTRNVKLLVVYASTQPGAPLPPDPSSPAHWKVWIIGTIFAILVSFSRGKWGPLLKLKDKIETAIDEAEKVADVVEEVAEGVEKVAEEAVKHLPEGKLHDAAELVEKVAEDIDDHAEKAEEALEKVEEMEKEVESFVESAIHQEKSVAKTEESKDQN